SSVQFSLGEVVYNSLPFKDGSVGINVVGTNGDRVGQSVRLSGGMRQVTQIEVGLDGNAASGFRIEFYELNGAGGIPGSLIWQSPIQIYPWDPPDFNQKVISVAVPNITVPDMFAWVVVGDLPVVVDRGILVKSSNPPTVGQSFQAWSYEVGTQWIVFRVNGGVYDARINALHEPSH